MENDFKAQQVADKKSNQIWELLARIYTLKPSSKDYNKKAPNGLM
jgi:hypothetical protein